MKGLLMTGMAVLFYWGFTAFVGIAIVRKWDLNTDLSFLVFTVVLGGLASLALLNIFCAELREFKQKRKTERVIS